MGRNQTDLRRTLGAAARLWAAPEHHEVKREWWVACSGELNVNYNVACCQSANSAVLVEQCLQPVLDLGKPAIIMLAGPGLATAQKLAEVGWVGVGALPLMTLTAQTMSGGDGVGARAISREELPQVRELLSDTYGLDDASAAAAVPERAVEGGDMGVWGLFDGEQLASCFTSVVEDGLLVVWSMATRREYQGQGYGRRLLEAVLSRQFDDGAAGSLLQSSTAGEKLYRDLGYTVVEHWQLWSRPRWVMARA
jgi:GNAT superfamily N-acetyltransferase